MSLNLDEIAARCRCLEYLDEVGQLDAIRSKIYGELQELNETLLEERKAAEEKAKAEAEAKAKADAAATPAPEGAAPNA